MDEALIDPSDSPFGPGSGEMAYLQGQVLAISAILGRPGLKQWNVENVIEKVRSPYEEGSQFDDCYKRGLADTLDFVTGL